MKIAQDPTPFHHDHELLDFPRVVAELGYEHIQLTPHRDLVPFFRHPKADDALVRSLRKACDNAGVGIASLLPVQRWSSPDEWAREAAVRNWRRLIQIAVDLEVKVIGTEFSGRPERQEESEAAFYRSLEELLPIIEREGLDLLIDPHPDDFVEDGLEAIRVIRSLNSTNVGMVYVACHTFHMGHPMREIMRAGKDVIRLVHVADTMDHHASHGLRYISNPPGNAARVHQHLRIGAGDVDWDDFFGGLAEIGFLDNPDAVMCNSVFAEDENAAEMARFQLSTMHEYVARHRDATPAPTHHTLKRTPVTTSPLRTMTQTTPTALWNDSSTLSELTTAIGWGAVGATCNPVIALAAIRSDLPRWQARIADIAAERPTANESQIGWQVVEEVSVEAARLLEPAFEEHNGRNGRLSMQTDPRLNRDAGALADQAEHFASLAPNIIVKIPATKVGIDAIEEATYRGVSMNVTVSFTVPQAVAAGEAIERGLTRREAEGKDVSTMGPVVTIMVGRLDDWLKEVVARDGLDVDPAHLEWAGVAAFKKAYGIFGERGLRARLLAAAYRNQLQWTELVGGDIVLSPPFGWQEQFEASGHDPQPRIDEPVDEEVLAALHTIPDFVRAYEVDGMTPAEFDDFGATRKTLRQFLEANAELDRIVRDVLIPAP